MDAITKKFLSAVKDSYTATEWEEGVEEAFAGLIFCDRGGSRGLSGRRWKNLLSPREFTTVADLRMDEIIAIKKFLGWDFSTLINQYKLGWRKLTLDEAEQLTISEGYQLSFDEAFAV